MKLLYKILLISIVALFTGTKASAQLSYLKFDNYKVQSINIKSLRSVAGSVEIKLKNDTTSFRMSKISGRVIKNGTSFIEGWADDMLILKGDNTVILNGTASLCPGIRLIEVLACMIIDPEDFSIDVSMMVTVEDGSPSQEIKKEGIPLKDLLGNKFRKQ